jgi:hypothetical protein
LCRWSVMNSIEEYLNNANKSKNKNFNDVFNFVEKMMNIESDRFATIQMQKLLDDIEHSSLNLGQLNKAISKEDWYDSWGKPYLKAWLRAHKLQICPNFKDASLQQYGGKLFNEIRSEVELIFKNIPPPKPSHATANNPYTGNFQQSTYNPSGPCFHGDCYCYVVSKSKLYPNFDFIPVKNIKKGDMVLDNDGNANEILCVIKTKIHSGKTTMIRIENIKPVICKNSEICDDLIVTPYHPIFINSYYEWRFPYTIGNAFECNMDYMYNFVLKDHHIMAVNSFNVITMGHNYSDDPVLKHPFFGSHKVIDELKSGDPKGWEKWINRIYKI